MLPLKSPQREVGLPSPFRPCLSLVVKSSDRSRFAAIAELLQVPRLRCRLICHFCSLVQKPVVFMTPNAYLLLVDIISALRLLSWTIAQQYEEQPSLAHLRHHQPPARWHGQLCMMQL